jgi:hypothetical protein
MKAFSAILPFCFMAAVATAALAHDGPHDEAKPACAGHDLVCATVATSAFAPDGALWTVWTANNRVALAASRDHGKTYAAAVTLPQTALPLDNGPDARPRVVIGSKGEVYVSFATRDDKYNGQAFIARSTDGGRSFAEPQPMTSDSPSQRFETVAIDSDGRAFAVWIDKRNTVAAKKAGSAYAGAALAYAWIDGDRGSLPPAAIAKDNTCECCRIAVAFAGRGRPVVMFRNIFAGSVRDHAVLTFADAQTPGPIMRVSDDDAVTDSCPHQGPSLAIGGDGVYHATWTAVGRKLKGVYYAYSGDGGRTFSAPLKIGADDTQISRPFVLAQAGVVYLAYKSFDGRATRVEVMTSRDAGKSWSVPYAVAETADDSDHPLLIAARDGVYLSWLSRKEGYRLMAVEAGP